MACTSLILLCFSAKYPDIKGKVLQSHYIASMSNQERERIDFYIKSVCSTVYLYFYSKYQHEPFVFISSYAHFDTGSLMQQHEVCAG